MTKEEKFEKTRAIQKRAAQEWVKAGGNGVLDIATGVGKTRIGVVLAGHYQKIGELNKVYIIVPKIVLIDNWKKEFNRWGYPLDNVVIECWQTAIKKIKEIEENYDLVIYDEAHNYFGNQNRALLSLNVKHKLLLSATIGGEDKKSQQELLNSLNLRTVFTYSLEDAENDGILADYKVYSILIDPKETIHEYKKWNYVYKLNGDLLGTKNPYSVAQLIIRRVPNVFAEHANKNNKEDDSLRIARTYEKYRKLCKSFYQLHPFKDNVLRKLLNKYQDRKILVFCKSKEKCLEFMDKFPNSGSYFSGYKNKLSDLEKFNSGELKILFCIKALNEGVDVNGVNLAIAMVHEKSTGTDTQQIGRVIRWEEGKEALFLNLIMDKTDEIEDVKIKTKKQKNNVFVHETNFI